MDTQTMDVHTKRTMLVLGLMVALLTATCTSRQASVTPPATSQVPAASASVADLSALTGKWHGWLTDQSGTTVPVQVDVSPSGAYQSRIDTATGSGTFQIVGGKIVASGHLAGPQAPVSERTAVASLVQRNGRPMLVGQGHAERGPYSFELMKD